MKKKENIESVVCNIIDKNVEVVGVPSDQWMRVRSEYINHRKQNDHHSSESTKIILKRKRLILLKKREIYLVKIL